MITQGQEEGSGRGATVNKPCSTRTAPYREGKDLKIPNIDVPSYWQTRKDIKQSILPHLVLVPLVVRFNSILDHKEVGKSDLFSSCDQDQL